MVLDLFQRYLRGEEISALDIVLKLNELEMQVNTISHMENGERTQYKEKVYNYFSIEQAKEIAHGLEMWAKSTENSWARLLARPIVDYLRSWQSIFDM